MVMMTTDFGKRITRLFYDVDNTLGDLSAHLQENVSGVQVVRAFAREPHEIARFDQHQPRPISRPVSGSTGEWSKVMPTTNLLITMGTILILMVGGPMVLQGRMTVGELVAFNAYLLMLSAPVQQLAWLVNTIGEAGSRCPARAGDPRPRTGDPIPGRAQSNWASAAGPGGIPLGLAALPG